MSYPESLLFKYQKQDFYDITVLNYVSVDNKDNRKIDHKVNQVQVGLALISAKSAIKSIAAPSFPLLHRVLTQP